MNARILDLVDAEIQRLISKGWKDYPLSKVNNLYLASEIFESKVSFPHEFYNIEMGNPEASEVWAQWRAKVIHKFLRQSEIELLWEVGSGHGNVAIPLQQAGMPVIGVEPLFNGAAITAKSGVRTYVGTLESLNIPDNSIRAVGVFDVLEHLEKPEFLLTEIYRVLQPGGLLMVSVPAHQWLFSNFDESIGHYRRYSRKLLTRLIEQCGFLDVKTEFLYSIFVLPAFLIRNSPIKFRRNRKSREIRRLRQSIKVINFLEPIIIPFLFLERIVRFPFGLSLFSVSRKSLSQEPKFRT